MSSDRTNLRLAAALVLFGAMAGFGFPALAVDWITAPGAYTHHPYTHERISQFAPGEAAYAPAPLDYETSGYRHMRSTLGVGPGADHLHVVERWGRPVRPYGEWQYPFRPYSTPYPLWGRPAPFVGVYSLGNDAAAASYLPQYDGVEARNVPRFAD
jgi:hypothetical protein